jgi:hypothetical protein
LKALDSIGEGSPVRAEQVRPASRHARADLVANLWQRVVYDRRQKTMRSDFKVDVTRPSKSLDEDHASR